MLNIGKKNKRAWLVLLAVLVVVSAFQACSQAPQTQSPTLTPVVLSETSPVASAISQPTGTLPSPAVTITPTQLPTALPSPTLAATASAGSLPDPQGFGLQLLLDGFDQPVELTHAGDGSGRLFVVEQAGRIRAIQNGSVAAELYLDITGQVGSSGSEQGLLGLAFHPEFAGNGYFYVNYTNLDGNTVISRYSVAGDTPDRADPQSEYRLLAIQQPYPNHNGGSVVFGPDGYLYLGLGDGGSGGDPQGNAQNTGNLLGKILRIDVNGGNPYLIPADNPFVGGGGSPEIWAYGLRNPWRFTFDALTGDMYIGDVGQNAWEEIDFLPGGSAGGTNFGWDYREGYHPYEGSAPPDAVLVDPVWEYEHNQGCSVTGGVVYRGQLLPEWQGVYLFGDYCTGSIWGLLRVTDGSWQQTLLFDSGARISSFGTDESGEVYVVGHGGRILQLVRKP